MRVIAFANNDMAICEINLHAIQRRHDFLAIGGEECREIFQPSTLLKIFLRAFGQKLIPNEIVFLVAHAITDKVHNLLGKDGAQGDLSAGFFLAHINCGLAWIKCGRRAIGCVHVFHFFRVLG